MDTHTDSMQTGTLKSSGGRVEGQSATDLLGFYGATPVAQPSGASQAAVTAALVDASGGAAAATNGILTLTGTYNSAIIANAIATLAAQVNAEATLVNKLRTDLVALGLLKGS